jgi:ribosomal protein S18 acetylase RimI-like enzyme
MAGSGFRLPLAVFRFRPDDLRRFLTVIDHTDQAHGRLMHQPHWYLWALGVQPEAQGQGIGGDLLQYGLAQADGDGLPCYLETQTERNIAFYERFGFRVADELTVRSLAMRLWPMIRESDASK